MQTSGPNHYSNTSDLRFGFEYLQFLTHHFIGRVNKITPSGRLQSAVLVILSDTLLLCSNRGGVHRCISLHDLDMLQQLPRGRLLVVVKDQHSLLLSSANYHRVVAVLVQLVIGLKGAALPVQQPESMPSIASFNLRPSARYVSKIPAALKKAIRLASISTSRFAIEKVQKEINPSSSLAAGSIGVRDNIGGEGRDFDRGEQLARNTAEQSNLGGAASSSKPQQQLQLLDQAEGHSKPQSPNSEQQPATFPQGPNPMWRSQLLEDLNQFHGSARLGANVVPVDTGTDLTILVAVYRGILMTFPALRSLWTYIKFAADNLPGAKQPPTVKVHCVEGTEKDGFNPNVKEINHVLFHQTMTQFSESTPHSVTVRREKEQTGMNFDSSIFWNNPLDQSAF